MQWLEEIKAWKKKESEKKQLSRRLEELKAQNIGQLEEERSAVLEQCEGVKRERDRLRELILGRKNELERFPILLQSWKKQQHPRMDSLRKMRSTTGNFRLIWQKGRPYAMTKSGKPMKINAGS